MQTAPNHFILSVFGCYGNVYYYFPPHTARHIGLQTLPLTKVTLKRDTLGVIWGECRTHRLCSGAICQLARVEAVREHVEAVGPERK